jgi:hypothetical protein
MTRTPEGKASQEMRSSLNISLIKGSIVAVVVYRVWLPRNAISYTRAGLPPAQIAGIHGLEWFTTKRRSQWEVIYKAWKFSDVLLAKS